jgi:hypothetical protein
MSLRPCPPLSVLPVLSGVSLLLFGAVGCGSGAGSANDAGHPAADVGFAPDLGATGCSWGSVTACTCAAGNPGTRRCLSDGTFAPCECTAAPDGAADSAAAGDGGPTSVDAAADGRPDAAPDLAMDAGADVAAGFEITRSLALDAKHLVADSKRKLLYATVGGTATMNPNSLVVIDPVSLSVKQAVTLGSDPSSLAMSDDGSTLWVGMDGAFAVRRVDLTTSPPTAGAQFTLPRGQFGDSVAAGPLAVLPGAPASLAVSLHHWGYSPSFYGAVVLDNGAARAMMTPGHTGASRLVAGPTGWLFGFNNEHTGFGFYALKVGATGLTQTEHPGLIAGFDTDIVYAANRVYATSGEVVDVSAPDMPVRAGKFGFAGLVIPRAADGRVLMISAPDSFNRTSAMLRVLDPATFTQRSSATISGLSDARLWDAVDLGGDTVAFLAGAQFSTPQVSKIHVLSSALVGAR